MIASWTENVAIFPKSYAFFTLTDSETHYNYTVPLIFLLAVAK